MAIVVDGYRQKSQIWSRNVSHVEFREAFHGESFWMRMEFIFLWAFINVKYALFYSMWVNKMDVLKKTVVATVRYIFIY